MDWAVLLLFVGVVLLGAVRTDLNSGVVALALSFAVGLGVLAQNTAQVSALFPSQLLLTILAVSLFFELAHDNGTLARITQTAVRWVGGQPQFLAPAFFAITFGISALGPGNIAATALMAPIGMRIAVQAGINPLLMAILICTGANAGTFSPVAFTGVLSQTLLERVGVQSPGLSLVIFGQVALLQSLSALAALAIFGRKTKGAIVPAAANTPLSPAQKLTLALIGLFVVLVVVAGLPAVAVALVLSAVMAWLKLGRLEPALKALPWGVMILIGGIGTLITLMEQTGSLKLATALLAEYSNPTTFNGLLALVSGLASIGSSSSGVVMPLLIPLAPELIKQVGSGNLTEAVVAINVGSHMVDVSPLSTLGALCLAALPEGVDKSRLFRQLLLWGLAMAVVAGVLAWLLLDVWFS